MRSSAEETLKRAYRDLDRAWKSVGMVDVLSPRYEESRALLRPLRLAALEAEQALAEEKRTGARLTPTTLKESHEEHKVPRALLLRMARRLAKNPHSGS